jgi:hypothetical protein
MSEARRIVVLGGMAQLPYAGVAWQALHYLEGLRRLGHDVVYIEDTQAWPYDPDLEAIADDATGAIRRIERILRGAGFGDRWAYRDIARDGAVSGMSRERFATVFAEADVLINLSGMTVLHDEHLAVPVRIYLETDPVTLQLEIARGDEAARATIDTHTVHFSFGERLGRPGCTLPVGSVRYVPTRQPVVLDWWAPSAAPSSHWTTIANWEQTHRDVEWAGERYTWSKSHEFAKLLDVPARAGVEFEAALALDDEATIAMLEGHGWRVREARSLSNDLELYRDFIRSSFGEFTAAKDQNVRMCTGWFSDRTATYLAAGRPAVVQDTGFDVALPVGEGLLAFRSADEAVAALEEVAADPERHSRAARAIAEEHFAAERVLARVLEDAGA